MVVCVDADAVAFGEYLRQDVHIGVVFRNDKECRLCAVSLQHIKQAARIFAGAVVKGQVYHLILLHGLRQLDRDNADRARTLCCQSRSILDRVAQLIIAGTPAPHAALGFYKTAYVLTAAAGRTAARLRERYAAGPVQLAAAVERDERLGRNGRSRSLRSRLRFKSSKMIQPVNAVFRLRNTDVFLLYYIGRHERHGVQIEREHPFHAALVKLAVYGLRKGGAVDAHPLLQREESESRPQPGVQIQPPRAVECDEALASVLRYHIGQRMIVVAVYLICLHRQYLRVRFVYLQCGAGKHGCAHAHGEHGGELPPFFTQRRGAQLADCKIEKRQQHYAVMRIIVQGVHKKRVHRGDEQPERGDYPPLSARDQPPCGRRDKAPARQIVAQQHKQRDDTVRRGSAGIGRVVKIEKQRAVPHIIERAVRGKIDAERDYKHRRAENKAQSILPEIFPPAPDDKRYYDERDAKAYAEGVRDAGQQSESKAQTVYECEARSMLVLAALNAAAPAEHPHIGREEQRENIFLGRVPLLPVRGKYERQGERRKQRYRTRAAHREQPVCQIHADREGEHLNDEHARAPAYGIAYGVYKEDHRPLVVKKTHVRQIALCPIFPDGLEHCGIIAPV